MNSVRIKPPIVLILIINSFCTFWVYFISWVVTIILHEQAGLPLKYLTINQNANLSGFTFNYAFIVLILLGLFLVRKGFYTQEYTENKHTTYLYKFFISERKNIKIEKIILVNTGHKAIQVYYYHKNKLSKPIYNASKKTRVELFHFAVENNIPVYGKEGNEITSYIAVYKM